MPVDLIGLGSLGGFAFAAGALLIVCKTLFDAWRRGELVSRNIHEETITRLVEENKALRSEHVAATRELARLARSFERLASKEPRR